MLIVEAHPNPQAVQTADERQGWAHRLHLLQAMTRRRWLSDQRRAHPGETDARRVLRCYRDQTGRGQGEARWSLYDVASADPAATSLRRSWATVDGQDCRAYRFADGSAIALLAGGAIAMDA